MPLGDYLFLLYIILPLWAVLLYQNRAYSSIRTSSFLDTVWPVIRSSATGGFIVMAVLYVFKLEYISRALVLLFISINAALLSLSRAFVYFFTRLVRKKGYNYRTILIVGTGERAQAFAGVIGEHREWGINVLGFISLGDEAQRGGIKIIGRLDELVDIITAVQVDEVAFVVPMEWLARIEEPVLVCENVGIKASVAADFYPLTIATTTLEELRGWPLLTFNPIQRMEEAMVFKRAIDIALSVIMLLIASPLFIASMIAVRLTSKGPVFFRQQRCGLNGRRFNLLKFRTMVIDADEKKARLQHLNEVSGPVFKMRNDPRVTFAGRFLRRYSLDELPQFINVLKGDMSVVGPRPPLPLEVEKYDIWQRRRLSVKPGITCLWQVNGRNSVSFDEWMRLDLEYIDNWSWGLDMKIVLKTIPAVFRGTGS